MPLPEDRWKITPMFRHMERHREAYEAARLVGEEDGYRFECEEFTAHGSLYFGDGAPAIAVAQRMHRLPCGHNQEDGSSTYTRDVRIPLKRARAFARWLLTMTEGMEG